MIQSGFLGRRLGPLLKTELPLMKNVIKPLAKSVLIPLGLSAVASAADAGMHKQILGSGRPSSSASHNNTILIISNDEMKDIIKTVKSLEDSGLLFKVNSIDTSGFVLKTKYDADKRELENKISDTSGLVKKAAYNVKTTEIEGKIPSISGLATASAITVVENKIPNINSLVKKQIMTQTLLKLKRNLLIIIMINIFLLQSLILQLLIS